MARKANIILAENPNWEANHFVDVRDPAWRMIVVEKAARAIVDKGFDGFFLDTVDSTVMIENEEPSQYRGMSQALVDIIKELDRRYPQMEIILNRGYGVLPDVASKIDYVLAESLLTTYDFDRERYRKQSVSDVRWQVERLDRATARNPNLTVLALDYWDPSDKQEYRNLYAELRSRGYVPYISTVELDKVHPEPQRE